MRLLLAHGVDPNAIVGSDRSPLWHAILTGYNSGVLNVLLEHGADPNQPFPIHIMMHVI